MTSFMPTGRWWCGLGFILKTSILTDYPTVCLILEVNPKSLQRAEIIKAMKEISEQSEWKGYELDTANGWAKIVREKSLQDFLSREDHISVVKEFFLQAIKELDQIKLQYPTLPWVATQDNEEALIMS
jgi:hypothetical protein